MKKNILAALLFLAAFSNICLAGEAGIKFMEKPWSEIKARSVAENKPIFLDAFASWCGPCKWLAANVFTNDSVADFYNEKFINAHFDMEKGEGLELAKQYGVKVYPTLLYILPDGEVMHRAAGSMPPQQFIELGMTALDPDKNFKGLTEKFEKNLGNMEVVGSYLSMLNELYVDSKPALEKYFATVSRTDMTSPANWMIIKTFVNNENSAAFKILLEDRAAFVKSFGEEAVSSKIKSVYIDLLTQAVRSRRFNKVAFDSLRASIMQKGVLKEEDLKFNVNFVYAAKTGDWKTWAEIASIRAGMTSDPGELNQMAWTALEKVDDKEVLKSALAWSKKSNELAESPDLLDTYANLLFKLGNKEEAVKTEEKALELARKVGAPTDEILNTLEEFKK